MSKDYLDSLRVFHAIVESKSFSRAAEALGTTTTVVSRAIAALEQRLETRLFHRTTRHVSLTETGERVYARSTHILDDLEALEAEAIDQAREPSGVLRLVAHTSATVSRLVPLVSSFKRRYPKVTLDLTLLESPVDLAADGYDIGIVVPYMLSSELTVTRLLERIEQFIVAAPRYLETHASPRHPADLGDHMFVPVSPSIRKPELTFQVDGAAVTVPLQFDLTSNNPLFNREMVLEGIGLGILPERLIRQDLASGRLVRVLGEYKIPEADVEIRLAYATRTLMPGKVRAFIDHAIACFDVRPAMSPGLLPRRKKIDAVGAMD